MNFDSEYSAVDVSAQTAVAAVETYEEVIRASQQASLSAQQADDTLRQIMQVTPPERIPMSSLNSTYNCCRCTGHSVDQCLKMHVLVMLYTFYQNRIDHSVL